MHANPMWMDWWTDKPSSRSATFFHETMHMSQLVTSPRAGDKARGAEGVWELARSQNTDGAVYNADSWQVVSTAIIAQKAFNLNSPPYPVMHPPAGVTVDVSGIAQALEPETVVAEVDPGFVPQGAGPREKDKPFHVDPGKWDIYKKTPVGDGSRPSSCKEPTFMNDCMNKNGKCFCKGTSYLLGVDPYTIEAKNCDAECKGCQYPMEGSC